MPSNKITTSTFPPEIREHITPHAFREISLSGPTLRSFLCPGGCDSNKDARDLLMRLQLQDTLGTSAPVLTQEQDNHNKVNLKG